jgi:hypothetical protein
MTSLQDDIINEGNRQPITVTISNGVNESTLQINKPSSSYLLYIMSTTGLAPKGRLRATYPYFVIRGHRF